MQFSKTIICQPAKFDEAFKDWLEKSTEEYRQSLNPNEIFCHVNFFNIIVDDIKHDGVYHYILYHKDNGGNANMPDDDDWYDYWN